MWVEGLVACVDERGFRLTPKAAAPFQKETRHCGPLGGEGFKVDDERRTASGWLTEQGKDAGPLGGGITALSGSSREAAYRLQHLHFLSSTSFFSLTQQDRGGKGSLDMKGKEWRSKTQVLFISDT